MKPQMEPTKEELERIEAFKADYALLVDKYHVDMFPFPVWIPVGNGMFQTQLQTQAVITDRPQSTPSPEEFIPKP